MGFLTCLLPSLNHFIEWIISLDDFRTFFVQELVAAKGTEEVDLLAPKFLIVAIKFTFALRACYPENFRHGSSKNKKFEIRSTKIETNRNRVNFSNSENPKRGIWLNSVLKFGFFSHFEFVLNFGFRASNLHPRQPI
jgi:hypothetical protein